MVDVEWLLDLVLMPSGDLATKLGVPDIRSAWAVQEAAENVLAITPLAPAQRRRLREALPTLDHHQKAHAWSIAAAHGLEEFDDAARDLAERLRRGMDDAHVGAICLFVLNRQWSSEQRRQFADGVAAFVMRDDVVFSWDQARGLELLIALGREADAVRVIAHQLVSWLEAYESVKAGTPTGLVVGPRDGIAATIPTDSEFGLETILGPFREAIADVAGSIPAATRVRLLRVSAMDSNSLTALGATLGGIDSDVLDEALDAITDDIERCCAVSMLASFGATPSRQRALAASLNKYFHAPMFMTKLTRAVRDMWSPEIANLLVEQILAASWQEEWATMTSTELTSEPFAFDNSHVESLLLPALARASHKQARHVLEMWIEIARRRG